ncbi:hypothetical protein D3C78_1351750 [compost metagenome]
MQQAQVFVGFRGDADRQVHGLAVAPVHALGEMQQAHAGAQHQLAGFRRAVGNRDALAEVGGTLRLAGLQPGEVAAGDQAVLFQHGAEQGQCFGLVRRPLVHANLPGVEFEHRASPRHASPGARGRRLGR